MGRSRRTVALLFAALALLAASPRADAVPLVQYTVTDLGGGSYRYDLVVDNSGGLQGLSGLNVLHGGSVFDLDGSSAISQPSGWGSFAPLPPLIDDLNWFSTSLAVDVTPDESLGGFSFVSTTPPGTLAGDDFHVEGIGADTATQIDLGIAQPVPEPTSGALLAGGCLALALARKVRRARIAA